MKVNKDLNAILRFGRTQERILKTLELRRRENILIKFINKIFKGKRGDNE